MAEACNPILRIRTRKNQDDPREVRVALGGDDSGGRGATLVLERGSARQPGVPAKVVDTVGAGDSFTAALTIGLLEENDPSDILETACQLAAEVCSHAGAVPQ